MRWIRESARAIGLTRILPVLALLVLAGCGDGTGGRSMAGMPEFCQAVLPEVEAYMTGFEEPTGERFGGTAVVGGNGEIADGMNALISSDYVANQHQIFVNLMTLVRFDENLEFEPWLAHDWEVSDDFTEITFHLRDDVYWHDGTPTTARDVEFTYLRATDPETAFPNSAFWDHYVRGADGIEVIDDHTVRLHLREHADFMDAWRVTAIMPRHLLEDVPPSELRQHPFGTRCPVGNGPFVFVEHRPDASWTFRRNPAFPDALGGPPHLDRYIYRVIPESTTRLTELLTGNLDLQVAATPDQVPQIEASDEVELRDYQFRSYVFVGWNSRRPQLADPRVRRALTVGTNRAEVIEAILGGYGRIANAGVPPFHWAYDEALEDSLRYDPDEARRLLDEAGWSEVGSDGIRRNADGERFEISVKYNTGSQQRQDVAEIMQSQLAQVGVAIRPQVVEWSTLGQQITDPAERDFDGVVMGWVTEFKVDDHDLFHSEKKDTPYGWAGTEDAELDMLLDTLQLIVDRDQARPFWHEYQQRLVALQPYTYFYFPRRLAGVNPRLRDVQLDLRGEWVNVKDWWIPAEARIR